MLIFESIIKLDPRIFADGLYRGEKHKHSFPQKVVKRKRKDGVFKKEKNVQEVK